MSILSDLVADLEDNLTCPQKAVLRALADRADHAGRCVVDLDVIAQKTGLTRRAASNAIWDMRRMVEVTRQLSGAWHIELDVAMIRDLVNRQNYRPPHELMVQWQDIDEFLATEYPREWGGWELNGEWRVLIRTHPGYEIELDTCTTSAHVLDWIMQVAGKGWHDEAIAGLVRAFNDVLRPQAHLCSSGSSKRLSRTKLLELVAKATKENE